MKLTLQRRYKGDAYTIGRLYIDGFYFCDTLEDTDRGLKKSWSLTQIRSVKVPGKTAIPVGTYAVTLSVKSPKFSSYKQYAFCEGYLPRLQNVPGYEGVLIHIGNDASQTDGCVLVGKNTQKGKVLESTSTFRTLYDKLKAASSKGEPIFITIQ